MDYLSEQYPTDQRKEEKHEAHLGKKEARSANSSNHIESEREAILFFNSLMVLIRIIVVNLFKLSTNPENAALELQNNA